MEPIHTLTDDEYGELSAILASVDKNPYEDYPAFSLAVRDLVDRREVPAFLTDVCGRIRQQRDEGVSDAHVLRNCPIDAVVPVLDHDDPLTDKYRTKLTFVSEAFLELVAQLLDTPLMCYETRNNGDFFQDVYAINRYSGLQTARSDSELYFHNDRTAHSVRADFVTLLGMRCPDDDLIYTTFVDGRDLLAHLTSEQQQVLRQAYFVTPFDIVSRESNARQTVSEDHPILEADHRFRYYETTTTVAPTAPPEAKDALIAMKNALVKARKSRHRILTRDLFVFGNQDGLHSRDLVEVNDKQAAKDRWLMKTYTFRSQAIADRYADRWLDGVRGRVAETRADTAP